MTTEKRLVESYDIEFNSLTKTLKMNLVLGEEAIALILQTTPGVRMSPDDVRLQVLDLLERSIYLNLPRSNVE